MTNERVIRVLIMLVLVLVLRCVSGPTFNGEVLKLVVLLQDLGLLLLGLLRFGLILCGSRV